MRLRTVLGQPAGPPGRVPAPEPGGPRVQPGGGGEPLHVAGCPGGAGGTGGYKQEEVGRVSKVLA